MDLILNISQQCDAGAKKSNVILGYFIKSIVCKTREVIIPFHSALVRPQLKHSLQFWAPHVRKDVDKLETVQRNATKMMARLVNLPYEEKLK